MKDEELFLLDSNVLIYAYDKDEDKKRKIASNLLSSCFKKERKFALTNQILAEFSSIFLQKGKGNVGFLKLIINDIFNCPEFLKLTYNERTILQALTIKEKFKIPFWDSLIVATMKENGIYHIYTENIKDFNIFGIEALNPFEKLEDEE